MGAWEHLFWNSPRLSSCVVTPSPLPPPHSSGSSLPEGLWVFHWSFSCPEQYLLYRFQSEICQMVNSPHVFPFSQVSAPSRIGPLLFTVQCLQAACFVFCPELIAAISRRARWGRLYLVPLETEPFSVFWSNTHSSIFLRRLMGNIFLEGSSAWKCLYFAWLILWLGMDILIIMFP